MGLTLRGRDATRPVASGSCRLIRIGDVSQDGTWLNEAFTCIEPSETIRADQFLQDGDVLFPNRGNRTTAIAYRLGVPQVIVGAQFFVVRPDPSKVLPEYLAWFMRTEEAARYFDERRKGTYVAIIERRDLEELELPLPPLEAQRKIADVAALAVEERVLCEKLAALKARLVAGELLGAARQGCTDKHR
jgi:restriction endonuclease S subunit